MATFKAEVQNKRADGTYNVRIRVTHNRVVRRLSTNLYVTDADLTRSLNFKNTKVIDQCDELIKKCRQACNDLGYEINTLDVDDLVIVLKKHLEGGEKFKLDFVNYMTTQAAKMKKSTGVTYLNTANALLRFLGDSPLDIADVNVAFLRSFENFLENEPSQRGANRKTEKKDLPKKGPRAISMYMGCVRAIHNLAKNEFNDEDNDYIPIPYSPFKKYKIKPQPKTRKRALTVKQIQKIIDLPYNENSRRTLAKDCFILSFALVGMNSIDLYNAPRAVLGTLNYNRAKTADRRDDDAEMKVKIEDCILQIVDKYKGLRQQFNFNKRYASPANFNRALNIGLKEIGAEIGEDKLEFYAARHSWATIARSAEINIDKATVHEALNHVDKSMKVTDIYIDRDWSVIWNANKKVLSLFDWSNVGYDVL